MRLCFYAFIRLCVYAFMRLRVAQLAFEEAMDRTEEVREAIV
jgi:hypothetical protein